MTRRDSAEKLATKTRSAPHRDLVFDKNLLEQGAEVGMCDRMLSDKLVCASFRVPEEVCQNRPLYRLPRLHYPPNSGRLGIYVHIKFIRITEYYHRTLRRYLYQIN